MEIISIDKIETSMWSYFLTLLILLLIVGQFGKQAIEWILLQLYQFFIQQKPLTIL